MVKAEWGGKRFCQKCHRKYYDMQRDPITCPYCSAVYQPEYLKSRDELRGAGAKGLVDFEEDVAEIDADIEPAFDDDEEDAPDITETDVKSE